MTCGNETLNVNVQPMNGDHRRIEVLIHEAGCAETSALICSRRIVRRTDIKLLRRNFGIVTKESEFIADFDDKECIRLRASLSRIHNQMSLY